MAGEREGVRIKPNKISYTSPDGGIDIQLTMTKPPLDLIPLETRRRLALTLGALAHTLASLAEPRTADFLHHAGVSVDAAQGRINASIQQAAEGLLEDAKKGRRIHQEFTDDHH